MLSAKVKEQQNANSIQVASKQRAFTGRVTKFHDTFGFVDDDVFFQLSVVKGGSIRVNDQVYVECQYSEQLPFKWNATKVEIIPQQAQQTTVASTYLQHRMMMQQRDPQPQAQSYYTHEAQMLQQTKMSQQSQAYQQQEQIQQNYATDYKQHQSSYNDYTSAKQQQQQLLYYSRQPTQQPVPQDYSSTTSNQFQQITYTSTPGSAFVSTQIIPYATQQVTTNAAQQQQPTQPRQVNRGNSTRWDEPRNRDENRQRGAREERNKFDDRDREKDKGRDRRLDRDRDPRFADNDRDRREKDRTDRDKDFQRNRRSDSPISISSANDGAHTGKPLRRRYDPVNIPKFAILKSIMNIYDIKQRYGAIHIPSDFREVRINMNFDLNILNIPKPVVYRIVNPKSENKSEQNSSQDSSKPVEDAEKSNDTNKTTREAKLADKYAVKVLFVSLPSMNDIYDRVFGSDRDNFTSSKAYFLHFNKLFSFLCSRNYTEGHSLIGGKFDASLDGFINNSNEPNLIATAVRCVKAQTGIDLSYCRRWKLIATFVYDREETLRPDAPMEYSYIYMPDVWSLLDKSSGELSKNDESSDEIKMVIDESVSLPSNKSLTSEKVNECVKNENTDLFDCLEGAVTFDSVDVKPCVNDTVNNCVPLNLTIESTNASLSQPTEASVDTEVGKSKDFDAKTSSDCNDISQQSHDQKSSKSEETSASDSSSCIPSESKPSTGVNESAVERQQLLTRLNDLKVAELKAELERRGHKIKSNLKKSDLVAKLRQIVERCNDNDEDETVVADSVKGDWWAKRILSKEETDKKEEQDVDDVIGDQTTNSSHENDKNNTQTDTAEVTIGDEDNVSGVKRKAEEEQQSFKKVKDDKDLNRLKATSDGQSCQPQSQDGFIVAYGDLALTVISLYQTLNHHKYDHFELSITSELLREFLIRHFASFILSALVYNKCAKSTEQETTASSTSKQVNSDNSYVQLAFAYFDSCHCGYLMVEDVLRLFHNCNIPLSKKVWNSLFGTEEKQYYRSLKEPPTIVEYFKSHNVSSTTSTNSKKEVGPIYVKDGAVYDVLQLITQSENDEKIKSELRDKLATVDDEIERQNVQINELESKQKKMNCAIEKQNDEICTLKREKELLKTKFDQMKKLFDNTLQSFTDLSKEISENKE